MENNYLNLAKIFIQFTNEAKEKENPVDYQKLYWLLAKMFLGLAYSRTVKPSDRKKYPEMVAEKDKELADAFRFIDSEVGVHTQWESASILFEMMKSTGILN